MTEPTKIELNEKMNALLSLQQASNRYFQGVGMFGPGAPPQTLFDEEAPRLYQYQPGVNLVTTPRAGYNVLPFAALRSLGAASKEIRLNIELIKRQVRGLEWEIIPARKEAGRQAVMVSGAAYEKTVEMQSVIDFFEFPDGVTDFDAWLNMLIEELLVTDAVTIYPNTTPTRPAATLPQMPRTPAAFGGGQGGGLILELIDGATIRPLVDLRGKTPAPPIPAYLQVLYGVPATHYPADQLLYRPLNTKVYTPYGESPIEWVLTAINTAIRKDIQKMGYFSEGNIPGVFAFLPENYTIDQVEQWRNYFEALVAGDMARASKIIWLPHAGSSSTPVYQFAQNDIDNIDVDKYLMQVACWAFGNSPAEFGIIPGEGLGGKGFMQGNADLQMRSMVWPITGYLKSFFNLVIRRYLKRPDLKFQWVGLDPTPDQLQMAQVDQIYTQMGIYDTAYVQDRLGVPRQFRPPTPTRPSATLPQIPLGFDRLNQRAEFGGGQGGGGVYFTRAVKAELDAWKEKAARALKKGWPQPEFESNILTAEMREAIRAQLAKAESPEQVAAIFEQAAPQEGSGANAFFRSYP